jgi:tetratricopeptide (TPR) repeat protein
LTLPTRALLRSSHIELANDHYRLARDYTLRASATHPQDVSDCLSLLQQLRTFNLSTHIHEFIAHLSPVQRANAQLLHAVAAQLAYQNESARALELIDQGLALQPGSLNFLLPRAQMLVFLGRIAEAESDFHQCIRRQPNMAHAWWALSGLKRHTCDSNHVAVLRQMLAEPPGNLKDTAYLGYALHQELHDLGDIEGAAGALSLACRSQRQRHQYSRQATHSLFAELKKLPFDRSIPARTAPSAERVPIFIVGMYRSGTTLLEQLLDGHPDVVGLGEISDFITQLRYAADHWCGDVVDPEILRRAPGFDYGAIGRGYLDSVEWRCRGRHTHFIDKLPANFLNVGFILQALPEARILHTVRDPVETCFSNLREFFSDGTNLHSYDQIDLADYYNHYSDLMTHWHSLFPGRILDVEYSELTRDTQKTLRQACDFCKLPYSPSMLDLVSNTRSVSTASTVQVRGPVTALEVPKWAPYRDYLSPLIRELAEGV